MIRIASGAGSMALGVIALFIFRDTKSASTPPQVISVPITGQSNVRASVRRNITCEMFKASLEDFIEDKVVDQPLREELTTHLKDCRFCQQKFTRMGGDMSKV